MPGRPAGAPGRGPPRPVGRGAAPGIPPGRACGGRGAPGTPPGRAAAGRPPPTPNGLLPTRGGRGAPGTPPVGRGGRSPIGCGAAVGVAVGGWRNSGPAACATGAVAAGRGATGRGVTGVPGRLLTWAAASVGAGCAAAGATGAGACRTVGATGAETTGAAAAVVTGAGADATGAGAAGAGAGVCAAGGLTRAGAAVAEPLVAGREEPLPAGTSLGATGNASRSLRTTGASMVEDGLFTNSPNSPSLAITSLLDLPSSLASSCTRALPTTGLLWVRPGGRWRARPSFWCCSSLGFHCLLTMGRTCFRSGQRPRGMRGRLCAPEPPAADGPEPWSWAPLPGAVRPSKTPDDALLRRNTVGRGADTHLYPGVGAADRVR